MSVARCQTEVSSSEFEEWKAVWHIRTKESAKAELDMIHKKKLRGR